MSTTYDLVMQEAQALGLTAKYQSTTADYSDLTFKHNEEPELTVRAQIFWPAGNGRFILHKDGYDTSASFNGEQAQIRLALECSLDTIERLTENSTIN